MICFGACSLTAGILSLLGRCLACLMSRLSQAALSDAAPEAALVCSCTHPNGWAEVISAVYLCHMLANSLLLFHEGPKDSLPGYLG